MAKNNKKPATPEAAPQVNAPEANKPANNADPNNIALTKHFLDNYTGMSPDATVTALERLAKMSYDDPDAVKHLNITAEHRQFVNELVFAGMTTMVIVDAIAKKTAFAITMNKAHFELLKKVADDIGVSFTGNYLPAPSATDADAVEVKIDATTVKPTAKTKEAIAAEQAITESSVELDPTKFKSEDDLKAALTHILVSEKGAFQKFQRTALLLKSYLLLHVKTEDEKKKVNEMTHGELLSEVFKKVSRVPIILNGFGKVLYRETSVINHPVNAFSILRSAAINKTTGKPEIDDVILAEMARVLIRYCAEQNIDEAQAKITQLKGDIKVLSSDKKKNAKGIEDLQEKIKTVEANIEHYNDVIDCVFNASDEMVKTFIEDLTDVNSENYKNARRTFNFVASAYYGRDHASLNQEALRKNVAQHIGIITNMFRNSAEQIADYSEANLVDLGSPEEKTSDEKN